MSPIIVLFFIIHFVSSALLLLFALNVLVHTIQSVKHRKKAVADGVPFEKAPIVTVQLPLFNELFVARRIIQETAKINWPKERLQIQVCDDSTDETLDISRTTIEALKKEGYWIELLHRTDRTGQKGGALREAMKSVEGEFIAIFDADFIPDPEFLQKVLPCFNGNPKRGMVQTRWGHLNSEYSVLTKAQAIAIDTHFVIEQVSRSGAGWFYNFNGTGGVWRKECIIDAGGWQDDTITEDLDLSYRAQMKGWEFHYAMDVVNPAELPVQLTAYKSQQFRWAKGSIQTAKKLTKQVLSSDSSFIKKAQALLHLSYYSIHPLLLLNAVALLPMLIFLKVWVGFENFSNLGFVFTAMLLAIAPGITLYAQTLITAKWHERITWLPWLVFFGTGLAVNNSRAVFEALVGKKSEFIRTPKMGITSLGEKWKNRGYSMPLTIDMTIELFLVVYLVSLSVWAVKIGMWYLVPFMGYYIISFGTVLWLQLWQNGLFSNLSLAPKPSVATETAE
jgi:cellulose synthase/poly-beta-1,6-N-acetylglucosamine synthase-like glycosyltransferase